MWGVGWVCINRDTLELFIIVKGTMVVGGKGDRSSPVSRTLHLGTSGFVHLSFLLYSPVPHLTVVLLHTSPYHSC